MFRPVSFSLLLSFLLAPRLLHAFDDGPPIAISSPDVATTFAYGSIKSHALIWDKKRKLLIAQVVFTDTETNDGLSQDDEHEFSLPGVSFDEAKGIFYAISARGETIPVAHIKKALFLKTIEVLPNANVRIEHPHGNVTVILEAIRPNDPAMHASSPDTNPDDGHKVDISKILQ
jgi:hypothetical protein